MSRQSCDPSSSTPTDNGTFPNVVTLIVSDLINMHTCYMLKKTKFRRSNVVREMSSTIILCVFVFSSSDPFEQKVCDILFEKRGQMFVMLFKSKYLRMFNLKNISRSIMKFTFLSFKDMVKLSPYVELVDNQVVGQGLFNSFDYNAFGNRNNVYVLEFTNGKTFTFWEGDIDEWRMMQKEEECDYPQDSFLLQVWGRWENWHRGQLYGSDDTFEFVDFDDTFVIKHMIIKKITLLIENVSAVRELPAVTNCYTVADYRKVDSFLNPLGGSWSQKDAVDYLIWKLMKEPNITLGDKFLVVGSISDDSSIDSSNECDEMELVVIQPLEEFNKKEDSYENGTNIDVNVNFFAIKNGSSKFEEGHAIFSYEDEKIVVGITNDDNSIYLSDVRLWRLTQPTIPLLELGR